MCNHTNDPLQMSDATGTVDVPSGRRELLGWTATALVLVTLAVPWFLWRDATVVAGLPLWVWWHVGWMVLASVVFYVFTERAWGVGVVSTEAGHVPGADGPDGADNAEVSERG